MWIVKLALRRPSTVIIVAILLLISGPLTLRRVVAIGAAL
jgi:hypothetical protein